MHALLNKVGKFFSALNDADPEPRPHYCPRHKNMDFCPPEDHRDNPDTLRLM